MSELTDQILNDMRDAVRGPMLDWQRLLLIGRLIAWQALAARHGLLPQELTPRFEDRLTARELRERLDALEHCEALGGIRFAFAGQDIERYESLSPDALTLLCQRAEIVVLMDVNERVALADAWVEAILAESFRTFVNNIPLAVADLVVRSLGLSEGQAVHCPGADMDAVAVAAMRNRYEPFVESLSTPTIAAIYAAITGSKLRYLKSDPLNPAPETAGFIRGVEACAAMPPSRERLDSLARLKKAPSQLGARSTEALGLEMVALGEARESAVVIPNGILAGRGSDADLRMFLVDNGPLKAVIGFPPGVLVGSSMPFSVLRLSRTASSQPVVFCKVDEKRHLTGQGRIRSRDRRFIGGDEILELLLRPDGEVSRSVPRDEIIAQDFVLTPERYLSKSAPLLADRWKETATLGDLVTIVKPQFLKPDEDRDGVKIQEAIPSEIPEYGYLERVDRVRTIEAKLLETRRQQILVPDDLLLSTKGTIGRAGIAKPDRTRPPLLPSQASVILRIKHREPRLDPRFLLMYLRSPMVQQAIASYAVGGTIPNISLSDLRSLPVWVATPEEQQPFIEAFERQAALAREIAERSVQQQQIANQAWVHARLDT